jgi:hypothetical protein
MLGYLYEGGRGVTQNYDEAVRWYRLAADQGDADAQQALADLYRFGWGVAKDYVEAHKWYSLAATRGKSEAAKSRDEIAAKMTPAQIERARQLATAWKPTK